MTTISREPDAAQELARRLVPAGTVLASLVVMAIPLPLAWAVMPNLALMFVAVWASIQPRLMPSWAGFLLGLLADTLFGAPIGVWALLFPLATLLVRLADARIEGHSLLIDWAFIAVLAGLLHLLAWQLLGFLGMNPPLLPFVVQAGMTALAYPAVASIAARIQRRLTVFAD
ncbi:MAG: rod shape-determining protein MreD [Sandaracinobacteroides sp.]